MKTKYLSAKQIEVLEILFYGGMLRWISDEPYYLEDVEGNTLKISKPTVKALERYGLILKVLKLSEHCIEYKLSDNGFKLINEA